MSRELVNCSKCIRVKQSINHNSFDFNFNQKSYNQIIRAFGYGNGYG